MASYTSRKAAYKGRTAVRGGSVDGMDRETIALSLKTYRLYEETKTNLIAHNDNDNTISYANVQQKDDTTKSDLNKLNKF